MIEVIWSKPFGRFGTLTKLAESTGWHARVTPGEKIDITLQCFVLSIKHPSQWGAKR